MPLNFMGMGAGRSLKIIKELTGDKSGVNKTYEATLDELSGFLKETSRDDAFREIFGSLFIKKAGLIAPNNTVVKLDKGLGVFSENILKGGAELENSIARKLSSRPPQLFSKYEMLHAGSIEKHGIDIAEQLGFRNAILSGFNYTDKHGGNLIANLQSGSLGALDFGLSLTKTSLTSKAPVVETKHISDLFSNPLKKFSPENKNKYIDGLLRGGEILKTYTQKDIEEMLSLAGKTKDSASKANLLDFVSQQIENTINATKTFTSNFAKGGLVKNKVSRPTYSLPSFDTGVSYLPKDMIAQLHEGERVLTKEENKNFSSGGVSNTNVTMYVTGSNSDEITKKVMVELDRIQKKNNKSNRGI
jgi:hypothetical protein